MGNNRPLPTKCFIAFLLMHGLTCDRISSSHHQYKKKGLIRTIPVWGDEKEIPAMHLRTSCKTLGVTMQELYDWAAKHC